MLGLWLGNVRSTLHAVEADWLRFIDAEGAPLPVPMELAEAALARANRLEAELVALRAAKR